MPDVAYFAGFFDADGSVGIHRIGEGKLKLNVQVSQVQLPVLEEFRKRYGGNIRRQRRLGYSDAYLWGCEAANGEKFLRDVLPHLIVKKERALIALEFRETFRVGLPRGRTSDRSAARAASVLQLRERLAERMSMLNARVGAQW